MSEPSVESYPLTPTQQGILFNSVRAGGGLVEIEQIVCRLGHSIDIARLRACWQWASERHAVLRTGFRWSDGEPMQEVQERAPMPFEIRDHARLGEAERDAELARFLEEDRERGFDLSRAPLARLALFVQGPSEHVLVWTFHHALLDGRSFTRVLREVFERYDGLEDDPPAPPPFRRHCEHLARRDTRAERAFWTEHLAGFRAPTPVPAARSAREAPSRRRHDEIERTVGADAIARLIVLGRERGFTLANAVQAAWAIALARHARTDDVCFGSTRAARHSSVEGALDMVGCLINTVPLRVVVRPDEPVTGLLRSLRDLNVAVRPHEQASLASMRTWARLDGSAQLFDTLVVFERYLMDAELRALGGPWAQRHFTVLEQSDFPIVLAGYQDGEDLVLKLEHDPMRCDHDAVERLLGHVRTLLRAIAEQPDARVGELAMLAPEERERMIAEAGGDGPLVDIPFATWPEAFAAIARERADEIALVHRGGDLSYAGLDRMAGAIAARLAERGVAAGEVVAVCVPRSPFLAAALVGTLRAGAVYLPIDPGWPAERIALLLADSGARAVLAHSGALDAIGRDAAAGAIVLDSPGALERRESIAARPIDPESPAYLLYTSGSTGKPKGVLVPHRALMAHARAIVPAFGLGPRDRCLQFTSPSFDVSLEEMLPTWLAGATVVLRSEAAATSVETFLREVERDRVTVLNLPSAFFTELALHVRDRRASLPSAVRLLIAGGEKTSAIAYAAWRKTHPEVRFLNAYGPTEVTITSTFCDPAAAGVPADGHTELPIGRPLGATRAYVLDDRLELVPEGAPGELVLAGPQVALGYLGRPEASAEKFVPDRFSGGVRMYRTGDLVRRLPGGELDFAGRIDEQVKIRGYRIEPGEIESALRELGDVRDAIVAARELRGSLRLLAWVVPNDRGAPPSASALLEALAKKLPPYMVPSGIGIVESFPLTPSGKIDKRALADPEEERGARTFVSPEGDVEAWIASLFCDLLGRDEVSAEDGFFDLGGHSLLAVRLLSKINARAKQPLDLGAIFAAPTVRGLARALQTGGSTDVPTLVLLNRADPSSVPLFCICGVQLYARLARAMEADRRVYGAFLPVEAQALLEGAEQAAPLDVPAMASAYIDLVREQRPTGPYLIGGISFGGVLAYEMAQQLCARGETVALVVLFDAILPRALHRLSARERARVHMKKLATDPRALIDHFSDRVRRHITRLSGGRLTPRARDERGSEIASIDLLRDELFRAATNRYDEIVQPYEGSVVLFQSRDGTGSETERVDWDRGWSGLVPSSTPMHPVAGTHLQILQEPGVYEIARVLRQHLRAVDDRPTMRRTRRASSTRISLPPGRPTPTDI